MKVIWTESAADDLAGIVTYIRTDDPESARRVAKLIFDRIMSLGTMPYRGRRRSTDAYRELVFAPWPYVAIYDVVEEEDKVYLHHIRHTARLWP